MSETSRLHSTGTNPADGHGRPAVGGGSYTGHGWLAAERAFSESLLIYVLSAQELPTKSRLIYSTTQSCRTVTA